MATVGGGDLMCLLRRPPDRRFGASASMLANRFECSLLGHLLFPQQSRHSSLTRVLCDFLALRLADMRLERVEISDTVGVLCVPAQKFRRNAIAHG